MLQLQGDEISSVAKTIILFHKRQILHQTGKNFHKMQKLTSRTLHTIKITR